MKYNDSHPNVRIRFAEVKLVSGEIDIQLRKYQSGDEREIVELLDMIFGHWPNFDLRCSPLDHWKWKYNDCPIKTSARLDDIATSQDRIVGYASALPVKIKVGEEVFLCGRGADLGVHPDFRGLGLSGKLIRATTESRAHAGLKFFYGATRNPRIRSSRRRAEIMKEFPIPVRHYAKIADVGMHLRAIGSENAWINQLGLQAYKTFYSLRKIISDSKSSQGNFQVYRIDRFDDRVDTFFKAVYNHYNFIAVKDSIYLNWRYCDPRAGDYNIKVADDDGHFLGYVVTRVDRLKKDYLRGYIVELLCTPGRLDVAETLLKETLEDF